MKQSSDYFGPYRLPEGWRWMRLGEISTKPQYGLSQAASPEPIGPKFVRITDITSGQIEWENVPYCRINTRSWEKYRLDEGDLLFARSGSIGATILIKEKPPCDAVFASYLIRIRLDVSVALPEFVDLFLKSSVGQAQLVPQGAAQKNINAKLIQRLLIPLPPLEEQRRIVARIEELMGRVREARRLREEARNDAERLWQAILAQTFPRPGSELPEGWRWVRLGEVCEIWDALRKPVKKKDRRPGDVPYCGANGIIDYVDGYTHVGEFVLLAEDGGFYGPGEPSAYMMSGRFWANNHVHILRSKPDHLTNQFLYYWLIACDLRPFLTGATRPKLT